MATNSPTNTEQLLTQRDSLIKQYTEYDGAGRVWKIYVAATGAKNNAPCTVSEYIYVSPTSSNIKARKEGHSVWLAIWDADFTISE